MYDVSKTVREFAVEIPQATRLFETLGIDYCCGGGKSLREACDSANIPVDEVVRKLLANVKESADHSSSDWTNTRLGDLVDYIVRKHHGYIREESPRLDQLLNKVASKHGEKHPELLRVQSVFRTVSAELSSHMMKEEQILFPYVKELEISRENGTRLRPPMFGSIGNPIHMMEIEHDSAGEAMRELRKLTNNYTAPEDGCFSYKTLFHALSEFETDLHEHVHLENNILFPRAIQMEGNSR